MGYEGGDLLLNGVAWPTVGSLPRLCAQAVGGGLGGQAAPVSDKTTHALYKSTIDVLPYLLTKRPTYFSAFQFSSSAIMQWRFRAHLSRKMMMYSG